MKVVWDLTEEDYEDAHADVKKDRRTHFEMLERKPKERFNSPCTNNQSRRSSSGRIDSRCNDISNALSDEEDDDDSDDDFIVILDTASSTAWTNT